MSEIAILSKTLAAPASKPDVKTQQGKSTRENERQDNPFQKMTVRTDSSNPKDTPADTVSNRKEKKSFSCVYNEAIDQDHAPQDPQKEAQSEQESLTASQEAENQGMKVQPQMLQMPEMISAFPPDETKVSLQTTEIDLDTQIQAPTDIIEGTSEEMNPEIAVQNQTTLPETGIPLTQQTEENKPLHQEIIENTSQTAQGKQKPQLPQAALNMPKQENVPQKPQELIQTDARAVPNNPKQQADLQSQEIQTGKFVVDKNVPAANETTQIHRTQEHLSNRDIQQISTNQTSQTAVSHQQKIQMKNNTDEFQLNGENPDSKRNQQTANMSSKEISVAPGFEIRNAVSIEHTPQPSENASVQATQTPSRTGIHAQDTTIMTKPAEQIAHHINTEWRSDQQSIRLTLTPPELGTVRMTFSRVDNEVVGMLEVEKPETRREIEQSLPQLLSSMQNNGVPVRRVELMQWNSGQEQARDNQTSDFNLSQQRESSHQDSSGSSMEGQNQTPSQRDAVMHPGKTSNRQEVDFSRSDSDKGLNLFI